MLQMVTVRLSILSFHFFRGRAIFCLQSISAIIVSHGSVKPISVVNLGPLDHLESFFKLSAAIISFQIEGFKTIAVLHPTFAFFFSRRNQKLQTAPLWLLQNSFIISNIREELLYYASGVVAASRQCIFLLQVSVYLMRTLLVLKIISLLLPEPI